MSEVLQEGSSPKSDIQMTFQSENAWMVQCLSLAALGMLTYLHLAPMIA